MISLFYDYTFDYIIHCRSYNSFNGICQDHRIIIADIKLSLRANKKKITANKHYNWTLLKQNVEIKRVFTKTLINHFSTLQNRDTDNIKSANTRYNHFEEACKQASSIEIPLKLKQEK